MKQDMKRASLLLTLLAAGLQSAAPADTGLEKLQLESRFKEGVHFGLTANRTALNLDTSIPVQVFVSYAYPETAAAVAHAAIYQERLPERVEFELIAAAFDQKTLSLARMFEAIEHLKAGYLHTDVFRWLARPGNSLVVMKSESEVDTARSIEVQTKLMQQLGVHPEQFRRALYHKDVDDALHRMLALMRSIGDLRAMPTVVVNGTYLTDSKFLVDAKMPMAQVFALTDSLIAMTDIHLFVDQFETGHFKVDPLLGVWHTVVPDIFELELKSGIYYVHREMAFGGFAQLTDLDTGQRLTGKGLARVPVDSAIDAMRAEAVWSPPGLVQLRGSLAPNELTKRADVWEVRATRRGVGTVYYLSPDGRYHFILNQEAEKLARAAALFRSADDSQQIQWTKPQTEGLTFQPSDPRTKVQRAGELARIADAATVTYSPSGAPRETFTIFMDPECDHCRTLFRDTKQLTAHGIKVRYIPALSGPLSINIWCAADRQSALAHAMELHALWQKCAREPVDGFQDSRRALGHTHWPTIYNSRGEVVVGYVHYDELMRVLAP